MEQAERDCEPMTFNGCKIKWEEPHFHSHLYPFMPVEIILHFVPLSSLTNTVNILKRDSEQGTDNWNKSVENLSEEMSARVNAHIVQKGNSSISKGRK